MGSILPTWKKPRATCPTQVRRRARKTRTSAWVDFIGLVVGWVEGMVPDISACTKNGNRCNRGKKLEEAGKEDGRKR
jgi:hypothetical protein